MISRVDPRFAWGIQGMGSAGRYFDAVPQISLQHVQFAAQDNRPIPQFLLIDQPTQVYFPSDKVYREADGSIQKTEKDADLVAVRRLFELLLEFTQKQTPGFQIIVTEHANLREACFQNALVEQPWAKPPALVPEDWLTLSQSLPVDRN